MFRSLIASAGVNGWVDDLQLNRRTALNLARRALRVAPDDPDVVIPAAYSLALFGEDVDAAIGLVDRALAFKPSFAYGWYWSGYLRLFAGQTDLGIEHFERCRRLSPRDPLNPRCLTGIATGHFFNRRFDDAAQLLIVSLEEFAAYAPTYRILAASYAHLGRLDEARAIATRLSQFPSGVVRGFQWYRNAEHRELLLSGLRLATRREPRGAARRGCH